MSKTTESPKADKPDLIAVEYSTHLGRGAGNLSNLDGCVGEVCPEALQRAKVLAKRIKEGKLEKSGISKGTSISVAVRFPLITPYAQEGFYPGWSLDEHDLRSQGVPVPLANLFPTRAKPVSQYEAITLSGSYEDNLHTISKVSGKEVYYKTHSLARLLNILTNAGHYKNVWCWRREWLKADKAVFMEARFYSGHVLGIRCGRRHYSGTAVQILARGLEKGPGARMASNVYLYNNSTEGIEYIDGSDIKTTRYTAEKVKSVVSSLRTPKKFMADKKKAKKDK